MFLEVFCVMPSFPEPRPDEAPKAYSVYAHTQTEMAPIRQKLLHKIEKQRQFSTPRENYAVIELNNVTIAGDFAVLSSLSGGYKMNIGLESGRVSSSEYDWTDSVFDDPSTRHLKGVIYFSLGHYESRRFLMSPNFNCNREEEHSVWTRCSGGGHLFATPIQSLYHRRIGDFDVFFCRFHFKN